MLEAMNSIPIEPNQIKDLKKKTKKNWEIGGAMKDDKFMRRNDLMMKAKLTNFQFLSYLQSFDCHLCVIV